MKSLNDIKEKKFWDTWYNTSIDSGLGSKGKLLEFKIDYLNKLFKRFKVKTVLDFGCGNGDLVFGLNCRSYFGIDISAKAIELCETKVNRQRFSFECAHFSDYNSSTIKDKFPSGLDCCICIDTLYHIFTKSLLNKTLKSIFLTGAEIIILYTIPSENLKRPFHPSIQCYCEEFSIALSKSSKFYKLVDKTKPRLGSAAGFFVYKKEKITT